MRLPFSKHPSSRRSSTASCCPVMAGSAVIYCVTCDQPLSSRCVINGAHRDHRLKDLKEAVHDQVKRLNDLSGKLTSRERKFGDLTPRIEAAERELEPVVPVRAVNDAAAAERLIARDAVNYRGTRHHRTAGSGRAPPRGGVFGERQAHSGWMRQTVEAWVCVCACLCVWDLYG
ncbi:hypothetical protein PGIGA_G00135240 [Pangasianodon gigas]|uniref:Uncharacterized protein n=1 Tax=Pangasianodon gigas TaxID=30993 RepID=A0ACC5XLR6_PANGG|nr:hypothetical protein [Pangasianodon gigas]